VHGGLRPNDSCACPCGRVYCSRGYFSVVVRSLAHGRTVRLAVFDQDWRFRLNLPAEFMVSYSNGWVLPREESVDDLLQQLDVAVVMEG